MSESSVDKEWASKYLLNPLTEPEPSQETGLESQFAPDSKDRKGPSVSSKESGSPYPTPPTSASPSRSSFHPSNPYSPKLSHRQQAFGGYTEDGPSNRKSLDGKAPAGKENQQPGRPRGSSLGQRFPGDMSHRPLDVLRKEQKAADRSPHLRKNHIPGADMIDSLDSIGGSYHHGGPYDATLLSRNLNPKNSPVEAVRWSNAEALKATPKEYVRDTLDKHIPLQGTAIIPSGEMGLDGIPMKYEEGADLMREPDAAGGAYKRWEDVQYHPDDLKGKGDPYFTIDRALKDHERNSKSHRRIMSDGNQGYEMQAPTRPSTTRQRSHSSGSTTLPRRREPASGSQLRYSDADAGVRRSNSNTTGHKLGETLRSRFGSLRRNRKSEE